MIELPRRHGAEPSLWNVAWIDDLSGNWEPIRPDVEVKNDLSLDGRSSHDVDVECAVLGRECHLEKAGGEARVFRTCAERAGGEHLVCYCLMRQKQQYRIKRRAWP